MKGATTRGLELPSLLLLAVDQTNSKQFEPVSYCINEEADKEGEKERDKVITSMGVRCLQLLKYPPSCSEISESIQKHKHT